MADTKFTDEAKSLAEGSEPATRHDVTEGGLLGAVGGAVVGALAGGPIGAIIGAIAGGAASAAAVDVIDKHDHDYARTEEGRDGILDGNAADTDTNQGFAGAPLTNSAVPEYDATTTVPAAAVAETEPVVNTYRSEETKPVVDGYRSTDTVPVVEGYHSNLATDVTATDNNIVIPVVEEELEIGKRQVEQGGARIHTVVTEKPVQEQVTLRDETVTIDRRPVDRVATDADLSDFNNRTIEVLETTEIPVVTKEAHVIEEVVVGKTATDRTETIRDTVRRTDVDVDELDEADTPTHATTRL